MKRSRVKKAKPFPLKPRRLTKAEKAKLTRERNVTTRAMRLVDPYYIHPRDVPVGKAYQWIALSILGNSNEDAVDRAKEDGWKPVPFVRHDFANKYRSKGQIIVNDMLLMENAASVRDEARKKEQEEARKMAAESPCSPLKREGGRFPLVSDGFIVSEPYAAVPSGSDPVVVPVTIQFSMDARWQDAAAGLGLTNEEYARRRLLMAKPILAVDNLDDEPIWAAVTLQIGRGE